MLKYSCNEQNKEFFMTQHKRIERDSLGEVELDSHVLYGAQTKRAIDNFSITGL